MAFKVIKPSYTRENSGYLGDKVRVSFPLINKIPQLLIFIGKDVAKKFGFQKGDRVILLVDDEKCIWQIKKDEEGYKLGEINTNLKLQITWKQTIPKHFNKTLRIVDTDVADGNLQINLTK
jgi:hypothetical protein